MSAAYDPRRDRRSLAARRSQVGIRSLPLWQHMFLFLWEIAWLGAVAATIARTFCPCAF